LFNLVKIETVFIGNEVDGQTQMAKPPRASNAVEVGFRILGKVEIDDNIYSLNVNASGEQVCAHEISISPCRTRKVLKFTIFTNSESVVRGSVACLAVDTEWRCTELPIRLVLEPLRAMAAAAHDSHHLLLWMIVVVKDSK